MENPIVLERFGELTKEEPLSTLAPDLIIPDTLVLEATSPFFGYYNDAPMADKEPYIFFVLEECPSLPAVFRAGLAVKEQVNHPLAADLGTVSMLNYNWPVIRVRDCEKYCRVKRIQQLFESEGIKFKKGQKKIDGQMALIRLQKFFYLRPVGDGFFLDDRDLNKAYFVLPQHLDWEAFKALTTEAKYETSILFFDAAQALYFEDKKIINLVRIYREHLTLDKLRDIRNRYLKVLVE
jgi:hypothetical protein